MSKSLDIRELFSNMAFAFLAQGSAVVMSMLTSLVLPKVLGVTEYGYWQLFIFYSGYAGIFHFGISEGVYLLNGGKTRDELNRRSIGSQFWFSLIYQGVITSFLGILAITFSEDSNRTTVIISTLVFVLLNNATYYLGYVFQAINETKKFSISIMIDRLLFVVPLTVGIIANIDCFEPYIYCYAFSKTIALSYCFWKGKDIAFASPLPFRSVVWDSLASIRVGVKLMFANLTSMLILGVIRFAIDGTWGIETFGKISLSLSMTNFFLQFIVQIGLVLFPALRRVEDHKLSKIFNTINTSLAITLPLVYLLYWPLQMFVEFWLPDYSDSVMYLALLLPLCVYDGRMNVCYSTYFKVMRLEKSLLCINAGALAISCCLSVLGIYIFKSPTAVVLGASIAVVFRSLFAEYTLVKRKSYSRACSGLSVTALFVVSAYAFGGFVSFFVSLVAYCLMLAAHRSETKNVVAALAGVISNFKSK